MKITWKPRDDSTGDPVVIGDNTRTTRGPGSKLILSARPSFASQSQIAAYPEAEEIETFGRGNIQSSVVVPVLYEFRSFGECTRFTFDANHYVDIEGILEIAHLGGGASVMQGICTGADTVMQDGCSAQINWTFIGGRITKGQSTSLGTPAPL